MRNDPDPIPANVDPTLPILALRPREAAKAIGVSEKTLWTWTQADHVPHVKRGKVVLYPVAQLREWLTEQAAQKRGG